MNRYEIITDSCADLPQDFVKNNQITVFPMQYHLNNKQSELSFYEQLRSGSISYTGSVDYQNAENVLKALLAKGKDVLYLGTSSYLFDNIFLVNEAAEKLKVKYPDRKIRIVDTQMLGAGQEALLWYVIRKKEEGESLEAVYKWAEENKKSFSMWCMIKDFDYFRKKGGLTEAAGMEKIIQSIVPVYKINGKTEDYEQAIEEFLGKIPGYHNISHIFITHGDCESECKKLCKRLTERYYLEEIHCHQMSPVVGGYFGCDTVMIAFLPEKSEF